MYVLSDGRSNLSTFDEAGNRLPSRSSEAVFRIANERIQCSWNDNVCVLLGCLSKVRFWYLVSILQKGNDHKERFSCFLLDFKFNLFNCN